MNLKNKLHIWLSEGKFCFSNLTYFSSLRDILNFWELLKIRYVSSLSIDRNWSPFALDFLTHQRTICHEWVHGSIRIYTTEKELQNATSGSFVQHGSYKLRRWSHLYFENTTTDTRMVKMFEDNEEDSDFQALATEDEEQRTKKI